MIVIHGINGYFGAYCILAQTVCICILSLNTTKAHTMYLFLFYLMLHSHLSHFIELLKPVNLMYINRMLMIIN